MPGYEHMEQYIPQIKDRIAATMLKQLLDDVSRLEEQLKLQQEWCESRCRHLILSSDDPERRLSVNQ